MFKSMNRNATHSKLSLQLDVDIQQTHALRSQLAIQSRASYRLRRMRKEYASPFKNAGPK